MSERLRALFPLLALLLALTPIARAQTPGNPSAAPLITQPIVETNLVTLAGNVRPEANAANDRGPVADDFAMSHMFLQLQRPAALEQTLRQLIDQMHDPASPNYHQWLTPGQFGAQFGPAPSDIQQITGWLQGHGFSVNTVYPSGMTIDFSGTAGQVAAAFHTTIHYLDVGGVTHFANMSDPQIPAALAPAIVGVVSLHDFRPRPQYTTSTECSAGSMFQVLNTCYFVSPADLATIYNFNPVFSAGNTGQNQTIHLIGNADLYSHNDWTTFRSLFGLSGYTNASLTTIHPPPPSGPNNCSDPGTAGDRAEATIDVEWSTAAAPGATLFLASCADNGATSGLLIALQNLINGTNPPAIISESFLECEARLLAAGNAAQYSIFQQGVAQGASVFVSAGDQGAAQCDYQATVVTHGINVNGLASTPYNVAVGGTDFGDTYAGTNSTYWSSTNSSAWGSAKSYVPEIPWDYTCASGLLAMYEGFTTTYGSAGSCNSAGSVGGLLEPWAGGGGPSGCATGTPSTTGVVSGTCAGYSKPVWQTGVFGIPNDGVRDLPDVSLLAGQGPWGHAYTWCNSNLGACSNSKGEPNQWAFGTSVASPIMAGVQALINQQTGASQGNPNYRYYQLAAHEYGTSGNSACNSSLGNAVAASCIFHDVTLGDIDTACAADSGKLYNCYMPSGTYGVLSTSNNAPAFTAGVGWDFATGIGTVNVSNLVMSWTVKTNTHDLNGDGMSDLAWSNAGNIAVWLMNGAQVLSAAGIGIVPTSWSIVGQRDFNGDGRYDFLWRDSSGNIAIWLLNGTQVVSSLGIGNIATTWTVVGTGDFNGDNLGDLLWEDGSGNLAVWLMNTGMVISASGIGNVPAAVWSVAGIGDFNGDGRSDILWRDSSGDASIWFMNGTQVASAVGLGNIPMAWSLVGTGDFNGDGKSDIVWRDSAGNVAIWLMNGASILSTGAIGNAPTTWTMAQTGDFDGDGKSDLLWRDSSGNTAIWFMNGVTVSSATVVGNIPTVWTLQTTNSN
jgi:Pro-kumamolisin, activation domain/FG-GAP-like repeat